MTASASVVRVLKEARKWISGQPDRSTSAYETSFSMLEAIDAALNAPHAAEQDAREAVAWRVRRKSSDAGFGRPRVFATDEASEADLHQWRINGYDIQPLYAALTQAAPDGWVLVPVEPTEAMVDAVSVLDRGSLDWRKQASGSYRAMISASPAPQADGWRPIETAPRDGSEFQGWIGQWEPRCRFNPETEAFETWGRVDYDEDGWDVCDTATHWRPAPAPPAQGAGG